MKTLLRFTNIMRCMIITCLLCTLCRSAQAQDTEQLIIQAFELFNAQNYNEAVALIKPHLSVLSDQDLLYYAFFVYHSGTLYMDLNDYEQAEKHFLEVTEFGESVLDKKDSIYLNSLYNLGLIYLNREDYTQAKDYFLEGKKIWEEELYPLSDELATLLNSLGKVYYALDDKVQAERCWLQAENIWENSITYQFSYEEVVGHLNLLYQDMSWREPLHEIEMVFVRGGTLMLGCTPEQGGDCGRWNVPEFEATVGDFYIGKYEVTHAQWNEVMDDPQKKFLVSDNYPATSVWWLEIQEFIYRLNTKTGKKYRLPTRQEWEYAARGGVESKGYRYSGSNDVDEVAWYRENSDGKTHLVGKKKPNELGLYDMSGNVHEWTDDWVRDAGNITDMDTYLIESAHIFRGGSWNDEAQNVRVTYYDATSALSRLAMLGFRLACDAE